MSSYISYIPDSTTFRNIQYTGVGKRPKFFLSQQGKGEVSPVKLVTPTEQTVERAKADLKRQRDLTIPSHTGRVFIPSKKKKVRKEKKEKKVKKVKKNTKKSLKQIGKEKKKTKHKTHNKHRRK